MIGKFAYSFDRETFLGEFDTRQHALEAAMVALRQRSDLPEGVFVGQWAPPNLQADHHAETLIEAMRDRWHSAGAEGSFLKNVTEQQSADLDHEIERTIQAWIAKHRLTPPATKIRAVSEHAVPNVRHVVDESTRRETSVIGEA
ncbi:MAG TPA: hypothetical protein VGB55_03765 [Tepidisphaeraceae bacterium]